VRKWLWQTADKMAQDDDIKNILNGEEIPFNPQHWEELKARLYSSTPSPFEEKAKDILGNSEVVMPAGAWDLFEQKMNNPSTPFEQTAKEKLESGSVAYNNEHWNAINERLNESATPFEKKAREILNSNEASFNANHWQQMDAMLIEESNNKGGFFTWKKMAAVAAVLFLSWATYAVINNTFENKTAEEKHSTEKNSSAINHSGDSNEGIKESEAVNAGAANKSTEKNSSTSAPNFITIEQENKNTIELAKSKRPKNKKKQHSKGAFVGEESFIADVKPSREENNLIEDNSILPAIAANHKNTKIHNDVLGSVENAAIAPDFSAQPFKYLTLPSSLPSSFLSNLWDNPAVAGLEKNVAVKVMYNTLWNDKLLRGMTDKQLMLDNPTNYYVSADAAVGNKNQFGVGAYYQRNDNNNWQSNNVNVSASCNKMLSKFTLLKLGVGATYCDNSVNTGNISFWEKSTTGGLLSTEDAAIENPERYMNYNAGAWLAHPLYFAGVSLNNLAQNTFTKHPELEITSNVTGGVNIPLSKKTTATIYAQRQKNIVAVWTAGAVMSFSNKVFAGLSVENSNYAAVNFGMNIADRLRIHLNGGMLAKEESLYLGTEKEGFVQGGIRYLITNNKKQNSY
jgi:type IX secretion system PorP/SprF family membrane protein